MRKAILLSLIGMALILVQPLKLDALGSAIVATHNVTIGIQRNTTWITYVDVTNYDPARTYYVYHGSTNLGAQSSVSTPTSDGSVQIAFNNLQGIPDAGSTTNIHVRDDLGNQSQTFQIWLHDHPELHGIYFSTGINNATAPNCGDPITSFRPIKSQYNAVYFSQSTGISSNFGIRINGNTLDSQYLDYVLPTQNVINFYLPFEYDQTSFTFQLDDLFGTFEDSPIFTYSLTQGFGFLPSASTLPSLDLLNEDLVLPGNGGTPMSGQKLLDIGHFPFNYYGLFADTWLSGTGFTTGVSGQTDLFELLIFSNSINQNVAGELIPASSGWQVVSDGSWFRISGNVPERHLVIQTSFSIQDATLTTIGRLVLQTLVDEQSGEMGIKYYYGDPAGNAGSGNVTDGSFTSLSLSQALLNEYSIGSGSIRNSVHSMLHLSNQGGVFAFASQLADTLQNANYENYTNVSDFLICPSAPYEDQVDVAWDLVESNFTGNVTEGYFAPDSAYYTSAVIQTATPAYDISPTTDGLSQQALRSTTTVTEIPASLFDVAGTPTQCRNTTFFLRIDNSTSEQVIGSLGDQGTPDTLRWKLRVLNGNYILDVRDGATGTFTQLATTGGEAALRDGIWHCLTISWCPGQILALYQDGVEVASLPQVQVPDTIQGVQAGCLLGAVMQDGAPVQQMTGAFAKYDITFGPPDLPGIQQFKIDLQTAYDGQIVLDPFGGVVQICYHDMGGEINGIPAQYNSVTMGANLNATSVSPLNASMELEVWRNGNSGLVEYSNLSEIPLAIETVRVEETFSPLTGGTDLQPSAGDTFLYVLSFTVTDFVGNVAAITDVPFLELFPPSPQPVFSAFSLSGAESIVTLQLQNDQLNFADGAIVRYFDGTWIQIDPQYVTAVANGLMIDITIDLSQLSLPDGTHQFRVETEYEDPDGCTHSNEFEVEYLNGSPSQVCVGGQCVQPANAQRPPHFPLMTSSQPQGDSKPSSDPISTFTGEFEVQVTDMRIPGRGIDFVWTRSHSSSTYYNHSEFGTAWSCRYFMQLSELSNGDINYEDGAGRIDLYTDNGNGTWTPGAHQYKSLTYNAGNSEFEMVADGEMTYVFNDFSGMAAGRLKRIEDRFGNALSFSYDGSGFLDFITDTYGRVIDVQTTSGQITQITDFKGRAVRYNYYEPSDPDGFPRQLKSVEAPDVPGFSGANRKTTVYKYNSSATNPFLRNGVRSITDPKGQEYLVNEYAPTEDDSDLLFGRVIRQTYGEGVFNHSWTLFDSDGNMEDDQLIFVLNDRRGLVEETRMNLQGNPVREVRHVGFAPSADTQVTPGDIYTDPDYTIVDTNYFSAPLRAGETAFVTTKTYDPEGKPLVTTLPRGNTITMTYNTGAGERHGEDNVSTTVRSFGSVPNPDGLTDLATTINYESTYQLVDDVQDPRGKIYDYQYDHQSGPGEGLLTKIVYPQVILGYSGTQNIEENFAYNEFGQLTLHTDGEGRQVEYRYWPSSNPHGNGLVDPPADGSGYLARVIIDPAGLALSTTYHYDEVGNVIQITDPRGHVTTFNVNDLNQVEAIDSPQLDLFTDDGNAIYNKQFVYDANDNVAAILTELENSLSDSDANVMGSTFTSASHYEVQFTYDILDNVKTRHVEVLNDPSTPGISPHLTTTYFYDSSENLVRIQYPNGDEDAMEYDERDLLLRSIVGDADVVLEKSISEIDYDKNGNVLVRRHPGANAQTPNNHIDTYTYDGFDRVKTYTDEGIGTVVTYTYDKNSNVVETEIVGARDGQPLADITLMRVEVDFDELNRPYETRYDIIKHADATLQGTATSKVIYDLNSMVVETENANGNSVLTQHDQANRVKFVTDAFNNVMEYVYDENSNVIQVKTTEVQFGGPSELFTVQYRYDELNRLRETEDDLQNLTQFALDSRGMPTTVTDAEGTKTQRRFDGLGRKFRELRDVGPAQQITLAWEFDDRSRMDLFTDGLSRQTAFEHDSHNRVTLRTNADTTMRGYTWDVEDNLKRLERENGHFVDFDYDDSNRLITRTYRDAGEAVQIKDVFEYNGLSALTKVRDDTNPPDGNQTLYERDSRSLVLKCHQTIVNPVNGGSYLAKTFEMSYDVLGNPVSMQYPGSRLVSFEDYNPIELVTRITTNGFDADNPGETDLLAYQYNGYGRMARRDMANTLQLNVGYDEIKRVQEYFHNNLTNSAMQVGFREIYDRVHNKRAEVFYDDSDYVLGTN